MLFTAHAQNNRNNRSDTKGLVQFSGVVLNSDSLQGLPYATVIIKGTGRGTLANYQGFFSLVAVKGDHVIFSSVGYQSREVVIPDTLSTDKYSIIAMITRDNVNLGEVLIYPWPTKEQFREAFLSLNIPDDQIEIAKKNLEQQKLRAIGETMGMDGPENGNFYARQEAAKYSYAGQVPPMNIFNPIAWAKFIQAWQHGDFKKKRAGNSEDQYQPPDINNISK